MMTRAVLITVLVCLSAFNGNLPAQETAVLPEITYKRLLNDLQVTVASMPQAGENFTVGVMLRYGSAFDPIDKGGLAQLLSRMIGKASLDRSGKDIQDELGLLSAKLDMRCDWDGIRFLVTAPAARVERVLLLLYQVVGEAVFDDAEFARTKAEMLQEIETPQDPRQRVRAQLEASLFRGTSYGRQLRGSKASIQNIAIGDVRLFYRRYFSPNASALVLAGPLPAASVLTKATRIWGVWVRKEEVPFTFLPPRDPAGRSIYFEDDPSSPAAQYILGSLWPKRDNPEFYPANLAARILQERMTKTLPTSLVTVGTEPRRMPGAVYIQGQAAAEQTIDQIRKVLDVVEEFKTAAIVPQELDAAQKRWIEEFNAANRTADGVCGIILDSELYRLGANYSATFPDLVRRSDLDAVKNAAKQWVFPGGVVIVVRGPGSVLKAGLASLGEIQPAAP